MHITKVLPLAIALLAGSAGVDTVRAQGADSPWAAWFGCWTASELEGFGTAPLTCVIPDASAPASAEFVTVRAGEVVARSSVRADGARVPIQAEGCTGWESARFSSDGARVELQGEVRCGESPAQQTDRLLAIASTGEWLDVRLVQTGGQRAMRAERSSVLPWFEIPIAVRGELASLERASSVARAAAARPLQLTQVLETVRALDASVAEVWIAEAMRAEERPFRVGVQELQLLADADVPERVIDVLVAVANPQHFQVGVTSMGTEAVAIAQESRGGGDGWTSPSQAAMLCSRLGWGNPWAFGAFNGFGMHAIPFYYGFGGIGFGSAAFGGVGRGWGDPCFGYSPFAFDNRFGLFGFGRAGMYPGFFPGYGGYPVQVTVVPTGPRPSGGRVVRGRGYTSGPRAASTTQTANPRAAARTSAARGSRSGASSGTASRSTSSGKSTTGSSGSGRTAKPRTP